MENWIISNLIKNRRFIKILNKVSIIQIIQIIYDEKQIHIKRF
jgi:hypothetical protein